MRGLDKATFGLALSAMCLFGAACSQSAPVQQPPGTIPSSTFPNHQPPAPVNGAGAPAMPTRAQVNDSYRWAHAMDTAAKAARLGAILGGPFAGPASAGMGLIGLLFGTLTADAQIAEEEAKAQAQLQTETSKDRQLEAAIEQELASQRAFENQINSAVSGGSPKDHAAAPTSPSPQSDSQQAATGGEIAVASIAKAVPPPQFKNVEVKDLNNDGVPDLWIYYNPGKPDEILRQEESSKGDGRVDTWSYFKDGKLVRRDVDNKGFGRADTVFYYEGQNIVREERDETGQGKWTYRADYQNGRLTKIERDTTGKGRPDLWITYDIHKEGEVVLTEERDLDGDGLPDLWSHYNDGRLARRDLNTVGLEFLEKQNKLPLEGGDVRQISASGS